MRWLEVRRHSRTKKGAGRGRGSHLSAEGVALARTVGAGLGIFAYVVASTSQRTTETAVAMGYAVDDTVEMPSCYVPGEVQHHDQWRWDQPYVRYAELISRVGDLRAVVHLHRDIWTNAVLAVPDHSGALLISHGGCIEPTLVSCMPHADHSTWGAPFAHCDGARLEFADGRFSRLRLYRAPRQPGCGDSDEQRRVDTGRGTEEPEP